MRADTAPRLTHASLFSGIGGFDLAARWAGWTNLFNCEIDPFCQKVLKYHFPNAEQYSDIKTTDFTVWRDRVDVLSGGFPCQPFSLAGKRKGTEDARHLWPEMLRAIREIQPRWVVGENVRGIINWSGGLVFDEVCTDLEAAGYEVKPFILPACGVGAPHRRDRVWFVAHRTDARVEGVRERENGVLSDGAVADAESSRSLQLSVGKTPPHAVNGGNGGNGLDGSTAHPPNCRRSQDYQSVEPRELKQDVSNWRNFPTQSPVCRRDDGFSARLDGITFPKW